MAALIGFSSDVARLVLGYLQEEKLHDASRAFCRESPHLQEEWGALSHIINMSNETTLMNRLSEHMQIKYTVSQFVAGNLDRYLDHPLVNELSTLRRIEMILSATDLTKIKCAEKRRFSEVNDPTTTHSEEPSDFHQGSLAKKQRLSHPFGVPSETTPSLQKTIPKCNLSSIKKPTTPLSTLAYGPSNSTITSTSISFLNDQHKFHSPDEQFFCDPSLLSNSMFQNTAFQNVIVNAINDRLQTPHKDGAHNPNEVDKMIADIIATTEQDPTFEDVVEDCVQSIRLNQSGRNLEPDLPTDATHTSTPNKNDSDASTSSPIPIKQRLRCRKSQDTNMYVDSTKRSYRKANTSSSSCNPATEINVISNESYTGDIILLQQPPQKPIDPVANVFVITPDVATNSQTFMFYNPAGGLTSAPNQPIVLSDLNQLPLMININQPDLLKPGDVINLPANKPTEEPSQADPDNGEPNRADTHPTHSIGPPTAPQRPADFVQPTITTAISSGINDDKENHQLPLDVPETPKQHLQLNQIKAKSLSTPRRHSHVRALNFSTPFPPMAPQPNDHREESANMTPAYSKTDLSAPASAPPKMSHAPNTNADSDPETAPNISDSYDGPNDFFSRDIDEATVVSVDLGIPETPVRRHSIAMPPQPRQLSTNKPKSQAHGKPPIANTTTSLDTISDAPIEPEKSTAQIKAIKPAPAKTKSVRKTTKPSSETAKKPAPKKVITKRQPPTKKPPTKPPKEQLPPPAEPEVVPPAEPLDEWQRLRSIKPNDWDNHMRQELSRTGVTLGSGRRGITKRRKKKAEPLQSVNSSNGSIEPSPNDTSLTEHGKLLDAALVTPRKSIEDVDTDPDEPGHQTASRQKKILIKFTTPSKSAKKHKKSTRKKSAPDSTAKRSTRKKSTASKEGPFARPDTITPTDLKRPTPTPAKPNHAHMNLATLLETPFKDDIPPTPRLQPQHSQATPFVKIQRIHDSVIKCMEFPTPNFPITPGGPTTGTTPPPPPSGAPTYGRATDYSSGSSYYRPDESEDIDHNITAAMRRTTRDLPTMTDQDVRDEVAMDGFTAVSALNHSSSSSSCSSSVSGSSSSGSASSSSSDEESDVEGAATDAVGDNVAVQEDSDGESTKAMQEETLRQQLIAQEKQRLFDEQQRQQQIADEKQHQIDEQQRKQQVAEEKQRLFDEQKRQATHLAEVRLRTIENLKKDNASERIKPPAPLAQRKGRLAMRQGFSAAVAASNQKPTPSDTRPRTVTTKTTTTRKTPAKRVVTTTRKVICLKEAIPVNTPRTRANALKSKPPTMVPSKAEVVVAPEPQRESPLLQMSAICENETESESYAVPPPIASTYSPNAAATVSHSVVNMRDLFGDCTLSDSDFMETPVKSNVSCYDQRRSEVLPALSLMPTPQKFGTKTPKKADSTMRHDDRTMVEADRSKPTPLKSTSISTEAGNDTDLNLETNSNSKNSNPVNGSQCVLLENSNECPSSTNSHLTLSAEVILKANTAESPTKPEADSLVIFVPETPTEMNVDKRETPAIQKDVNDTAPREDVVEVAASQSVKELKKPDAIKLPAKKRIHDPDLNVDAPTVVEPLPVNVVRTDEPQMVESSFKSLESVTVPQKPDNAAMESADQPRASLASSDVDENDESDSSGEEIDPYDECTLVPASTQNRHFDVIHIVSDSTQQPPCKPTGRITFPVFKINMDGSIFSFSVNPETTLFTMEPQPTRTTTGIESSSKAPPKSTRNKKQSSIPELGIPLQCSTPVPVPKMKISQKLKGEARPPTPKIPDESSTKLVPPVEPTSTLRSLAAVNPSPKIRDMDINLVLGKIHPSISKR